MFVCEVNLPLSYLVGLVQTFADESLIWVDGVCDLLVVTDPLE